MAKFGKKKSYTDWLYTRPVLVFVGGRIIFLGVAVFERFGVERDMYARRISAEAELSETAQRKENLNTQVEYLEGERGIEEEIRKHFDVAREGETVVILMGEDGGEEVVEVEVPLPNHKWYQFWR